MVTRKKLLKLIDSARVEAAIQDAERRSSGEISVSVSRLFWGDVTHAAEKAFERLGMTKTEKRNGVLIFVVPARRKFVVLGDSGIHEKVGAKFWTDIAAILSERFHKDDYTGGLVAAIEQIGARLAEHFPYDADSDVDELSDRVDIQ
ncbi:MAG: TPM domain-containing protein [candidate division Zixibacteria bacterium]|nr:TPM domain-containing protein [candidate division Zixibacteria bacterium]